MGLGSVGIVLPSSGQPTDPCEGIFITTEAAACGFHHSQGEAQGCTGIARAVVWSNMFRNTFQSGFLSILYSLGSKPLEIWQGEGKRGALRCACLSQKGWMVFQWSYLSVMRGTQPLGCELK